MAQRLLLRGQRLSTDLYHLVIYPADLPKGGVLLLPAACGIVFNATLTVLPEVPSFLRRKISYQSATLYKLKPPKNKDYFELIQNNARFPNDCTKHHRK